MPTCPLCECGQTRFATDKHERLFYQCGQCDLIFVPDRYFLSSIEEQKHYTTHQNGPDDLNYRKFLSRLATPMLKRLEPCSHGLDFGSGPGPTLSVMFEEAGHSMEIFDCFFANDIEIFQQKYDFISATEVFEHLHRPKFELERLISILKPSGLFGVMTMHPPELSKFEQWHYIIDPTHVCFYSQKTFEWIANQYDMQLEIPDKNVAIFRNERSNCGSFP